MSTRARTALVTLAGGATGAAVVLVVVLTNPGTEVPSGELALILVGAVALGGLMALLRVVVRRRARAAGLSMRRPDQKA